MLYIFPHDVLVCSAQAPFIRHYLNSDTYIHLDHKKTLHSPAGEYPITLDMVAALKSEIKLTLEGTQTAYSGWDLYRLSKPWPSAAFEYREPVAGLRASQFKNMGTYFYKRRIGIFGGPGTGKTCLARGLANYLNIQRKIVTDTPYESASTFIARYGAPRIQDQIWLFLHQWEREEDIALNKTFMVSDCPHPLGYLYASSKGLPKGPDDLKWLPWIQEMALRGMKGFDSRIYLPFNEARCIKDGIRIHDPEASRELSARIKDWLEMCGGFYTFEGGMDDLPQLAQEVLEENPKLPR